MTSSSNSCAWLTGRRSSRQSSPPKSETPTAASLLRQAREALRAGGIDSPELTAERLLAHVLKCSRAELYATLQRPLTVQQRRAFQRLLARRLQREPLQYVLGEVDFMGLTLQVAPGVLIPRPETEILVEKAVEFCTKQFAEVESLQCLDVGTGSGNIALSLAAFLPRAQVVAVDCSAEALRMAEANLTRLGLAGRVRLIEADVRAADFVQTSGGAFHLVTANLPYVPSNALPTLQPEVRDYEPWLALDGGADGLELYRALVPKLPELLDERGAFFAEVGEGQGGAISELLHGAGFSDIQVFADLAGKERVVSARK
ncbi:MAG: peptide chain release factor N(5)-glutamine methyltransferase [candidate division KSB1 bacterium]|nr:peptide chain release factor N(5)-glutamine methyltransferase [candidate division KSB1 bacterium]